MTVVASIVAPPPSIVATFESVGGLTRLCADGRPEYERRRMSRAPRGPLALLVFLALALRVTGARADDPAAAPVTQGKTPVWTLGAYVEAAYTYALGRPSNDIINYRGFDNRHNTFTIQNAVIDAQASIVGLSARVTLQAGSTPNTYYASEPNLPGTPGASPSSASDWKYIQQAYAGYTTDKVGDSLAIEAGIFLSPIGVESMVAKDDWNYSRSNLFFALPFYHTGARLTLQASSRSSVALWVVNGWNSVVDNNEGKSILASYSYKIPDKVALQVLYMGGPERPKGAVEGQPNRHLLDATAQVDLSKWISIAAEADGGLERNVFGTSTFAAGALYARVHPWKYLYVGGRGDAMVEHRGADARGTASAILFPAAWTSSGTFTLDGRPHENVSVRLEYRHDQAASAQYFQGTVQGDGVKTPYVPNATRQDTITAALLAWF